MNTETVSADKKKFSFNLKKSDYIIIASFFFIVLALLLYTFYSPNYYEEASPYKFKVAKGESISQVLDSLYSKGIIDNRLNMKIAYYLMGQGKTIKAGNYYIPNGLNYFELVDLFTNQPHRRELLISIPEGMWQNKLAGFLKNKMEIDSAAIMRLSSDPEFISKLNIGAENLEGFLLPEGYYFWGDATPEEIMTRMKTEQDKIFNDSVKAQMSRLKLSREQILTLASIIDGESNDIKEFKRISGVYHNRLRIRMPLQADPTIQYLVREKRNGGLQRVDFDIKSPFNTYKNYGLPPSPINNPGKDAILAAVFPEKHNFLYFVADGTGSHVFAKSFSDHERNVAKYRKWLRSRKP